MNIKAYMQEDGGEGKRSLRDGRAKQNKRMEVGNTEHPLMPESLPECDSGTHMQGT